MKLTYAWRARWQIDDLSLPFKGCFGFAQAPGQTTDARHQDLKVHFDSNFPIFLPFPVSLQLVEHLRRLHLPATHYALCYRHKDVMGPRSLQRVRTWLPSTKFLVTLVLRLTVLILLLQKRIIRAGRWGAASYHEGTYGKKLILLYRHLSTPSLRRRMLKTSNATIQQSDDLCKAQICCPVSDVSKEKN